MERKGGGFDVCLNGSPARATEGGTQQATTVVIQYVKQYDSGFGDKFGGRTPKEETIGTGKGWVLRNGKAYRSPGSAAGKKRPTTFVGADGQVVAFAPGQVWVVLVNAQPSPSRWPRHHLPTPEHRRPVRRSGPARKRRSPGPVSWASDAVPASAQTGPDRGRTRLTRGPHVRPARAHCLRDRHRAREARHGRDAQGRRHHGRRHAEQAKIAEDAGAVAVMALERVPADIRAQGGVSRMSDPDMIDGIIAAVSIPVMAKARIGHFVEAQVLQSLGVDYIDESEVLTPADYANHIDKWPFTVPFVCGATNLGEALRRITEGAAMIRSKGEAGTGDVSNATKHMRTIRAEINRLSSMADGRALRRRQGAAGAVRARRRDRAPRPPARGDVHRRRHRHPGRRGDDDAARRRRRLRGLGHLQVRQPGRARQRDRPGDAALRRPAIVAKVTRGLGEAMVGINVADIPVHHRLEDRGW